MVTCSGFGLPMHAQLLRLFVTHTPTHHSHITPHPVPSEHSTETHVRGTHHGHDKEPRSARTTETAAPGQPPGAVMKPRHVRAGALGVTDKTDGLWDGPDAEPNHTHTHTHTHQNLTRGNVSRAAKAFETSAVAEPTEQVLTQLEVLHPDADPPTCLLYTSPSPRDRQKSRMPSSA